MPRVPYVPTESGDPADLVAAIRARRGGMLLNLDRMLLRSPPIARAWNDFLGAVRTELGVDAKLRELVICAVGLLNGAEYELHHHGPLFLRAGGTEAQLAALRRGQGRDDGSGAFDETERAILRLTLEMTRDVSVRDATFDAVRTPLGERGAVELVALVATYNMVSRFLVALGVEPE
jgi:alkylhydroperoxidase family enzyme